MKIFLNSIGCRLNQSEIESLGRRLLAGGHEIVSDERSADTVVINTCAVTSEAARDARKLTRRIHRANPDADILLTGCYATIAPDELEALDGVTRVVLNNDKDELVRLIDPQSAEVAPVFDREPILRDYLSLQIGNTRAFVKAQDGCDNHCTFCVTTIARGTGRSRRVGDILAEVQALARAGYQEVVLTGVHLGSYGHDFGERGGLYDLVAALLERTEIARLRLSSLEPWDIAPGFFDLWQESRLLPHLHLPLQSGCDRTLKRMARNTTCAQFRELADTARDKIPDLNLSTDVIVGFPGESDADFEASLDFVRDVGFTRLHVFSYSGRPGTAAAALPDHVPGPLKKERAARMIALGRDLALRFHQRFLRERLPVLWETAQGTENGLQVWNGYTDNYIRVRTKSADQLFNRVVPAVVTDVGPEICVARICVTQIAAE